MNVDKFLGIGRVLLGDVKQLIEDTGQDFDSFRSVLDFGCGCGRVARYLPGVTGTDIDREAIEWCRKNLSGTFDTNEFDPPLKYSDASFDLVYAISIFTHLPEETANAWLAELHRILRPGGLLIATAIGESDLRGLIPDAEPEFAATGFHYTTCFKTEGLPDQYGLTFHSRQYIETHWTRFFDLLIYHPQAINNHQTGIVLRKKMIDLPPSFS